MLIDATHDEETRVAVVDDNNNRLLEFDYESKFRKPLKGSIFLAKVTRVEPSLQAAFVNFGGNRHGFLPFSEIHPDYYRIPISDREALLAEQEQMLAEEEEREEAEDLKGAGKNDQSDDANDQNDDEDDDVDELEEINSEGSEIASDDEDDQDEKLSAKKSSKRPSGRGRKKKDEPSDEQSEASDNDESDDSDDEANGNRAESENGEDDDGENKGNRRGSGRYNNNRRGGRGGRNNRRGGNNNGGGRRAAHRSRQVEVLGGTEYEDEEGGKASDRFRYNLRRQYKIQEVIKRGQIMLIQASREERGNKGAAVTTYLSLPGRYGVLMPNSPRAGGVSRKIAKFEDRQRMRSTLKELDVPKGMSVILRTAGVTRTKTEIKRDVDYLMRLWDDIRERTLQSSAPALIYEEADLIKRAVRDLYTRDVEEIHVSGDEGFDATKKFMKMMIPSHVKKVKEYKDEKVPLFHRYRVENQIAEINETSAKLKSGGYLVINPTEALVSIDVNSGRATKERHIEETALNTNMEAAEEVARQLRLRDLGGLVVIDFIDMEDRRNNAKVERKLKESLSGDRARIQIGRISSFGLLELSRQRLNPSLTEAQYDVCKHCEGRGVVRNADSTSIMLLRGLEEEGIKGRAAQLIVHVSSEVALYMLNNKRKNLDEIERRYGFMVLLRTDDTLGSDKFRIEVARPTEEYTGEDSSKQEEQSSNSSSASSDDNNNDDDRNNKRKRGRRGGRGRGGQKGRNNNRDDDGQNNDNQSGNDNSDKSSAKSSDQDQGGEDNQDSKAQNKRGGRRSASSKKNEDEKVDVKSDSAPQDKDAETKKADEDKASKPKPAARGRKKKDDAETPSDKTDAKSSDKGEDKPKKKAAAKSKAAPEKSTDKEDKPAAKKAPAKSASKKKEDDKAVKVPKASNDSDDEKNKVDPAKFEKVNEPPKAKKKGWWNKLVD